MPSAPLRVPHAALEEPSTFVRGSGAQVPGVSRGWYGVMTPVAGTQAGEDVGVREEPSEIGGLDQVTVGGEVDPPDGHARK